MGYFDAVDAKFFQDRPGNAVKSGTGRVSGVDGRKVDRVDPVFCSVEKGAEAHHLAFHGAYGFVRDMITEDSDGLADVVADVLCRDIAGRVVVDEGKGVVHGKTEKPDIIKTVIERVIGQHWKRKVEGWFPKERFADSAMMSAKGANLLLEEVAFPEQLFPASAGKPEGPYPDEQFQLLRADGGTFDEVDEGGIRAAPVAVSKQAFDDDELETLHVDEADPGVLAAEIGIMIAPVHAGAVD